MELTVLTPQDLESIFVSNPDQFAGFERPLFFLEKVKPAGSYRVLYRLYAMVPYQVDLAYGDGCFTGIYEKLYLGIISKPGYDYIRVCFPGNVFVDTKLHS